MTTWRNELLATVLNQLPAASAYCVAYSGGIDSHVLLHLLSTARESLRGPLKAVHVNHGIQRQAVDWSLHCQGVCDELDVPFEVLCVDGNPRTGESPEAAARSARYRALGEWLAPGAVLISAQHRDDQAETLLLQLFRGAGPRGLAAMPTRAALGAGSLLRPLLDITRADILDYAHRHRLRWVEDPSNLDTRYSRNFLRHRLLPEMRQHWQGIDKVLARAARLQAEQVELSHALAAIDLAECWVAGFQAQLQCVPLTALGPARQRNLLRHWIEQNALPMPPLDVLERVGDEVLGAAPDANPRVHWPGGEVRRYRERLYLMTPLPMHDTASRMRWQVTEPLALEAAGGTLSAIPVRGEGLAVAADSELEIRFRQGGERLRPTGRGESHALKNLFQEWGVPDWERVRVPLIYLNGELVAVAGLCVAQGFQAEGEVCGYRLAWSRLAAYQAV